MPRIKRADSHVAVFLSPLSFAVFDYSYLSEFHSWGLNLNTLNTKSWPLWVRSSGGWFPAFSEAEMAESPLSNKQLRE